MSLTTRYSRKKGIILIIIVAHITLLIWLKVSYIRHQKKLFITKFYNENENNNTVDETKFKETIYLVKYTINTINQRQIVHNVDTLGAVNNDTPILVIQVHANSFYFKEILESLKSVLGITKSLLIFSHDYFEDEINRIVKNVTFVKYIQIFYPYSVQSHRENDFKFCSDGFKCMDNRDRKNAVLVQRKLFWWWLLNQVFNKLEVMNGYNGRIIFLEEGNIVTDDLLHVLKMLERILSENYPQCEILNLGAYAPSLKSYHIENSYAVVEGWNSKLKNLGIAFNRSVWNVIKRFSYDYCYFNDYNWDNSMRHIGTKKPGGKFLMLNIEGSRVFKIDNCPNNSYSKYCNINFMVKKIQHYMKTIKKGLYPRNMVVKFNDEEIITVKEAGFFNDVRDRKLCMYF